MGVLKDIGTSVKLEFFEKIRAESKIFKIILDFGLKCLNTWLRKFAYSSTCFILLSDPQSLVVGWPMLEVY